MQKKFQAIVNKLNDLFREYPEQHGIKDNSLSIIHASRDPNDNRKFSCHTISWSKDSGWIGKECNLPNNSTVLFSLGSGAQEFDKNYERYEKGAHKGTSRAVFHCFCDSLMNTKVSSVGGAPQLVGVIRKPRSKAFTYGVIYRARRMFLGAHIDNLQNFDTVQWRNENFELCDPKTKKKRSDAQPQPDPLRRQ